MSKTLTQLAAAAVRAINAADDLKLKKINEVGSAERGAAIYRDKDWNEYRVLFFKDGAHQVNADYHGETLEDAQNTAAFWVTQDTVAQADSETLPPPPAEVECYLPRPSRRQREGVYYGKVLGHHRRLPSTHAGMVQPQATR